MKRNIIIILIAACVAVTWYVDSTVTLLDSALKSRVEAAVMADERFPARPVWWHDDSVMAIGVVKGQTNPNHAADKACKILKSKGISTVSVEVYDVVKIQKEDDWQQLAASACQ